MINGRNLAPRAPVDLFPLLPKDGQEISFHLLLHQGKEGFFQTALPAAGSELCRIAECQQPALPDNSHKVSEFFRLRHVVSSEKNRRALL